MNIENRQREPSQPSREGMTDENSADLRGCGCETSFQFHFGFRSAEFWHTTRSERMRTCQEIRCYLLCSRIYFFFFSFFSFRFSF